MSTNIMIPGRLGSVFTDPELTRKDLSIDTSQEVVQAPYPEGTMTIARIGMVQQDPLGTTTVGQAPPPYYAVKIPTPPGTTSTDLKHYLVRYAQNRMTADPLRQEAELYDFLRQMKNPIPLAPAVHAYTTGTGPGSSNEHWIVYHLDFPIHRNDSSRLREPRPINLTDIATAEQYLKNIPQWMKASFDNPYLEHGSDRVEQCIKFDLFPCDGIYRNASSSVPTEMFVVHLGAVEWCEKKHLAVGPQPFLTAASQSVNGNYSVRSDLKPKHERDLLYIYGQSIQESGLPVEPKLLGVFFDKLLSPRLEESIDTDVRSKYRKLCKSMVAKAGRERVCKMAQTRPSSVSDLFQLIESSEIAAQVQAACVDTLVDILDDEELFNWEFYWQTWAKSMQERHQRPALD